MIQGRKTRKSKYKRTEYVRVFPALVVDLVHIAIALVVRVLRLRVEYFGLVQEFKVKAEHFLVLRVFRGVGLGRSHDCAFFFLQFCFLGSCNHGVPSGQSWIVSRVFCLLL